MKFQNTFKKVLPDTHKNEYDNSAIEKHRQRKKLLNHASSAQLPNIEANVSNKKSNVLAQKALNFIKMKRSGKKSECIIIFY